MNEIQKIDRTTDLAVLQPGTYRAIDVRSQMITVPEVIQALTPIERRMLEASIKTPVADFSDEELTHKIGLIAKYIARDAGIKSVDDYEIARFMSVLKLYYSLFSLQEIRMAFEFAMTGELDEFLPRDKDGNPDKNHYQTFNIEYITKILNAYKKRRRETEHKGYKALPEPKKELTPEEKRFYHNQAVARCREVFLLYKYTGRFELGITGGMLIYDWLRKLGFANEVAGTEDDRKQAFARYMQRVARGFVNKYEAYHVRRKGADAPELDFTAYEIARDKEIKRTFDRMIAEEIQIDNYLFFI